MKGKIFKVIVSLTLVLMVLALSCCNKQEENNPDVFVSKYTEEEHKQRIYDRTLEIISEGFYEEDIADIWVDIVYSFHTHLPKYFVVQIEFVKSFLKNFKKSYLNAIAPYNDNFSEADNIEYNFVELKHIHLIGFIENDEYFSGVNGYNVAQTTVYLDKTKFEKLALGENLVKSNSSKVMELRGFRYGESSYSYYGYKNSKKYYGYSVQAVLNDNNDIEIIMGYQCVNNIKCVELHRYSTEAHLNHCQKNKILSEDEEKTFEKMTSKTYPSNLSKEGTIGD